MNSLHRFWTVLQAAKDHWWLKYAFVPMASSAGPIVLAVQTYRGRPTLALIIIGALWPAAVAAVYGLLEQKPPVSQRSLMQLLTVIDRAVGTKGERFGQAVMLCESRSHVEPGTIFEVITQPRIQIDKLVDGVWTFFDSTKTDPEVRFRVALAEMGSQYIQAFACFFPIDERPRSSLDSLQSEQCAFTVCMKKQALLVIEDIQKEGTRGNAARFQVTDVTRRHEEGSMICFPIIHRVLDCTPFVLSVVANKRRYFRDRASNRKVYEYVMGIFAKRISLEYSLERL